MISDHPDARHDWQAIADYARLMAFSKEPWVLAGHSVHRNQPQQIKSGRNPAFVDPDGKVRFATQRRGRGTYLSVWVRYLPTTRTRRRRG